MFSFDSISGEKRFQTIQDLVADGLITMYIDTYAKDYVDTMMISPVKSEEKKNAVKDETKENEPGKETADQTDATGKDQVFNTLRHSQYMYYNFHVYILEFVKDLVFSLSQYLSQCYCPRYTFVCFV